ncbi:hypothetical protein GEMRC1_010544 [Eukaryota sp. GEM-RC1]
MPLEAERSKLTMELNERLLKVEKLQKKKETIESKKESTVDGEKRSQSYMIVANAQKREELQREGDELDKEIKRAVKDLQQLEDFATQTEASNSAYKKKLLGEDELTETLSNDLKVRAKSAVSQVNNLRKEKLELEQELSYKQQILNELQCEYDELQVRYNQVEEELTQVRSKIQSLEESEQRSKSKASQLSAKHRREHGTNDLTQFERNVFAKQFIAVKKEVSKGLVELLDLVDSDTRSFIVSALNEVGVSV